LQPIQHQFVLEMTITSPSQWPEGYYCSSNHHWSTPCFTMDTQQSRC